MHIRTLTVALLLLATPLVAAAQQTAKVPRIGYLALNLAANPHVVEAFLQGLRDLGYVERDKKTAYFIYLFGQKLHKITFLLIIDYVSRQAYNVFVIMAPCEH